MKKGFFSETKYKSTEQEPTRSRCGTCGLYKNSVNPKIPPMGKGKKKILFVTESPGEQEDIQNSPLIGKAQAFLSRYLRTLGVNLKNDCWVTHAVICRKQKKASDESNAPDNKIIKACRPNLINTINKYEPNVIVLLGGVAMKSLLSFAYKEDIGVASRWADFCIPCRKPNTWIIPTYHPSYVLQKQDKVKVLPKIFKEHIKLAVSKSRKKPWKDIPNYNSQVDILLNTAKAAKEIRRMTKFGGPVAFDYETNSLKPDHKKAKIVSCSVCWKGVQTIAYPWEGEVLEATRNLILSPSAKIASNLKFEERWTKAKLNCSVRNWKWDTMIAAHVLNNAPAITSIKFQAFVLLGVEPYDTHIKPFLSSTKENQFNRIEELDIKELLLYNGLDSSLEYEVAMKQIQLFNRRE